MARAPDKNAARCFEKVLRKWDLTLDVPVTYLDLTSDCRVPSLMPSDYIAKLFEKGFLHKLLGGSVESCNQGLHQANFGR